MVILQKSTNLVWYTTRIKIEYKLTPMKIQLFIPGNKSRLEKLSEFKIWLWADFSSFR
jgi:hypothetical protein